MRDRALKKTLKGLVQCRVSEPGGKGSQLRKSCIYSLAKAPETSQLFIELEHKEKYPRM